MNAAVNIDAAVKALAKGLLVAFPTETVYGLGADATDDKAVAAVFAAKGRPSFNPLISHVASLAEAEALGEFQPLARTLAEAFWPGPLTIVVPRKPACPVSLLASAGLPSIALRVPRHPLALLRAFGKPVVAPSANPSGRISPTTAAHVAAGLGASVAMILDGGPCAIGLESTVVSFTSGTPQILRPGGVTRQDIARVLGTNVTVALDSATPESPGQLASHYAPHARLRLNADAPRAGEVYLGFGPGGGEYNLSPTGDLVEAAANLFRLLHAIDQTNAAAIAVASVPMTGLGEAINDRLSRAAAPRPLP